MIARVGGIKIEGGDAYRRIEDPKMWGKKDRRKEGVHDGFVSQKSI